MELVTQFSPGWRLMRDMYKGKFHCYVLQKAVEPSRARPTSWRDVSWPTNVRGVRAALQRHAMTWVDTKRYTGRRQAEDFDKYGYPQRPIDYPVYEVGHYYDPGNLDLSGLQEPL